MTNRYAKPKPARLKFTHNEASELLTVLDYYMRTTASNATLRSVKLKLGTELARVKGGTLRGSGR